MLVRICELKICHSDAPFSLVSARPISVRYRLGRPYYARRGNLDGRMRRGGAPLERGTRLRAIRSSELYYSEAISHAFVTKQYGPSFPPNESGMSSFISAPRSAAFSSPATAALAFSHGTEQRTTPEIRSYRVATFRCRGSD